MSQNIVIKVNMWYTKCGFVRYKLKYKGDLIWDFLTI